MSDKNRPGMGFEVNIRSAESGKSASGTDPGSPFRMAVLGDFSGQFDQPAGEENPLARRKPVLIDRDNFDEILAGFNLSFDISLDGSAERSMTIHIDELDDFHPDALYDKLEIFSKLRGIRRRLKDKNSFGAAAAEIMGWLVEEKAPQADAKPVAADQPAQVKVPEAGLLDSILDSTPQPSSDLEKAAAPGAIDHLVRHIIAPYVEPATDPRQPEMLDAVDAATAGHMRQILHHPRFQAMEAAWRSVYFLVSRIETDRHLKIYLLDAGKQALQADFAEHPSRSHLHKLFCDPAIGEEPWSLLLGNYSFEDSIDDALLLAQIGDVARQAAAPFIAGAKETLAGCASFADYPDADDWKYTMKSGADNAWKLLRQDAVADYLGLALPRFLLRTPYGAKSSPIEAFKFEEMPEQYCHECFLWGNAAFIKAEQLARAFAEHRWNMRPGEASQTDSLPMYYYADEGEMVLMPCAETYLTEKGGKRLAAQGLMPVWSVKNMDAVRSSDFASLSVSGDSLRGRWI